MNMQSKNKGYHDIGWVRSFEEMHAGCGNRLGEAE
jgi:hypothetical protein